MVVSAEGVDVLLECQNKTEFITVIHEQLQQLRLTLNLQFADSLQYTIKLVTLVRKTKKSYFSWKKSCGKKLKTILDFVFFLFFFFVFLFVKFK